MHNEDGANLTKVLVLGSSGATGRLVVNQLLQRGVKVVAILRPTSNLPEEIASKNNLALLN